MVTMKKQTVRMICLTLAVCFVLGIAGLAVGQGGSAQAAAPAGHAGQVGYVNTEQVIAQHPDMAKVRETYQQEVEQAKKDFEVKTAAMNDKEKQDYYNQTQQRLNNRQQELMAPVIDKVNAAIKAVADAKGLTTVLEAHVVVYGGVDITSEVVNKLK